MRRRVERVDGSEDVVRGLGERVDERVERVDKVGQEGWARVP